MATSANEGECFGKQIFMSYYSAQRFARFCKRHGQNRIEGTPYRCKFCHGWHLTTNWQNLNKRITENKRRRY